MKTQKVITNAALTAVCLLLVIPNLAYTFPFIVGAESSYTVMSGSMSPALNPGDLVIVKEEEPIDIGDMVTVESEEFTYTHRVVERLEGDRFRLKGDANEEADPALVEASQIIGKVVIVFPFGYLYTSYVFALALLVPAALIIGRQMYTIHQFTRRRNKREMMIWRKRNRRSSIINTSTLLLALILTVSTTRVIAPHFISGSSSYFSDVGWAKSFFGAGIWEVGADIEIEPDIEPDTLNLKSQGQWITVYIDTEYDEGDIVVNSVMLDSVIWADWGEVNGSLMVKFNRASVIAHLKDCKDGEEVTLTISGEFRNGIKFTGKDTIKVIHEVRDDEG